MEAATENNENSNKTDPVISHPVLKECYSMLLQVEDSYEGLTTEEATKGVEQIKNRVCEKENELSELNRKLEKEKNKARNVGR